MSRFYLPVPKEFNFTLNYAFLERSPRELLHRLGNGTVYKLLKIDDQRILFKVKAGDGRLIVETVNGDPTAHAINVLKTYVREWFDLETDLRPFYKMASGNDVLKGLVKKFYGYRIIGQPDLFESLVWAVLGQQINLAFAYTLKQRFVEHFGERLFWQEQSHYLFPSARLVSELRPEHLLPLQFSRQKSLYTITIAEQFASGAVSKEKLAGLPLEEAKNELMKIKGVGNWTANYALMKTFRYPNAFPLEDAGLHNAIKNLKKMNRKPTTAEVKRIFTKFKGWEAYATLYLWKSL